MNVGAVDSRGIIAEAARGVNAEAAPAEMARQAAALRRQNQAITGGEEEKNPFRSPSGEEIKKMVEEMQAQLDYNANLSLKYSAYGEQGNNKLHRIAVSVVDKMTGDVIREIPVKEIQTLYTKMSELAGIIFSRQA